MSVNEATQWSTSEAAELYEIGGWSKGYFAVDAQGEVVVRPRATDQQQISLPRLVEQLRTRGLEAPILIRFGDILQHRLGEIHRAFRKAIDDHHYQADYACIYPIKVNQQRQVVEEVLHYGAPFHFGLEAGSKPELLAVMAMAADETPIVCNGFKDAEFIEAAMLAQKIGRNIIPIVEKYTEFELILRLAAEHGVRPRIGMRVKLSARGAGRWQGSAGFRSKFGLSVSEILQALEELKSRGMEDCFELLHYHMGSQITNIRPIKAALIEAARIYAELRRLGAGLKFIDVGGGLGVDYDGSQTNFESSMNYSLQEYANDVIYHIGTICDDAEVPHPHILSESGRATVAYHSVLVFNVLGVSSLGGDPITEEPSDEWEQPLIDLMTAYRTMTLRNVVENFHDAQQAYEMAMTLFTGGYLPLQQRALAEKIYWAVCRNALELADDMEYVPEEFERLPQHLADTYFCNFSLFQSMPDSWAIKQLFPIMPIHRLTEEPTRNAVLGDITCDSDGKIDRFIGRRDVQRTLRLHKLNGSHYYLGVFLLGAYQEILGDLHNLFGDTNAVHVRMDDQNRVIFDEVIAGETVTEVLDYVQFDPKALMARWRASVEQAVHEGRIDDSEAGRIVRYYEDALRGYTYLEEPPPV